MDKCINISHKDFQELVRQSNINPLILKSKVGVWQEANNSDEFPTIEQLGIKAIKVPLGTALESFLSKLNIDVKTVDDVKALTGYDAAATTDLLYKTILISNTNNKEDLLVKETAYVAYSFLGTKNKIRTDLISSIENIPNYQSIYDSYKERNPNLSDYKIKELIVVDFIADAIKNEYNVPKDSHINRESEYWKIEGNSPLEKKLKYLLNKIKRFIKEFFTDVKLSEEELNSLASDIAKDIITSNFNKFGNELSPELQLTNYEGTISREEEAKKIVEDFQDLGLLLTGSLAIRKQGTLYRSVEEDLHDLDFTVTNISISEQDRKFLESLGNALKVGPERLIIKQQLKTHKIDIIEKIKEKFPNFIITNAFGGLDKGNYTLSGTIGEYSIDLFFVGDKVLDKNEKNFQDWQEIFKAKIRMGRAKDIRDFANYIPFNSVEDKLSQEKGFRHFNFEKIKNENVDTKSVSKGIGRISTKQDPIIIPLTDSTRTAYKEANLLDEKGEVKLLEEKEAFAWVNRHDTYENAMYSIAARYQGKYPKKKGKGTVDMYRMFMAEKFVPEAPKNNVVGRVATKFQSAVKEPTNNEENILSYLAFKKDLKIAVQKKFEEYKITHSNIKNTPEYKAKVIKFNTILSNLKNEIEKVDVKDADIVFKVFIDEINDLNEIIDKLSPEDYANYEVDDRIEKLVNMFLDESLKHEGNTNSIAIDGSSFHNYGNMINKVIALRTKYKASYSRITLNLLKQNPLYFAKTYNMSPEELKIFEAEVRSLTENVDDINELQKNFLGSNSNDDSIGILVADVSLKYNLQKVQEMIFKYCEELKELDSKLSSEFKDGKVSFDTFFEKDQHGVETGKIVHLYSSEYFDELEKFDKLNENFNYARKEDKIKLYRDKVNWLRVNTEVIDFRKLQYFKDKFGSRYDKHFVFSSSEMSAYEEILRRNLGKYYDIMIEELEENLNDFETFRESKEMEDNEYKYKHIKEESPWEFLDNYYNTFDPNQSLRPVPYDHNGNPQQALLRGNYNTFVPRKSIKEGRYYNNDFDKVQESDNMFQYWNILRQLHSKHIDPILTSKGYNLHNITYAKFLKESAELLADTKNIKWMKKVWNGLLTKYKDIWTDTRSVKDSSNQEEVIKNYSDKTKETIKRFENLLKLKDVNQLIQMIDERGITLDRSKKLNKKDLAEIIARHDVLSMYSKDLTKITLALTELATTHRARVETANSIEVVRRYNSTILDKNRRTRKNSQDKLESWVDTVIYNRRNSESMDSTVKNLGKVFNETDKKLTDVVKEIRKSNGDMAFTFQGISYYKVDDNYKSITIATSEEHLLDKEKFELALEEYISDILKQRGTPITLHSILTGILKVKIMTGLGWNLKSGVRNRIEGTITNIIRDSQGDTWKPGTINYAKAFMAGINMVRLSEGRLSAHGKKRMDQQKTFIELFQNLGVYEDRKNELDRKNTVSKFGKLTRNINMYTASVDLPEFKNQGEIVFCMLANLKVTAENGQEFDFFDKETMEFTLFEPGTTIVKEGFRTAENLGWETFQLNNETTNQFFIHKTRIDEVIKHTQGNYSNLDSIKFQEKLFGRAMMLFMRWFPEHLNQRFGSRRFNLVQENSKYMGRYKAMYNNPALLGIGTTATLLATFGPATAAILGAGGFLVLPFILKKVFNSVLKTDKQIILHSYTLKSTISMLQEVLIQSLNLPMKMARIRKGHISTFKEFSLDNLSNDTSDFSKEEVRAMKGMCMEIAVMLDGILLYVAMKALGQALGAGDDDDDEKKKHSKDWDKLATTYFFNYVSNTGKQLISSFLSYANPLTIFEQNSKIALVRMGDETIKLISYIIKYAKGEERGGTKMADKILTFQPFLPLPSSFKDILVKDAEEVGQGQYPFFDKRIYREDIWMEQMFQSEEKKAQKEVNARRQTLNEELDLRFRQQLREYNPELTEYEVQEEAKKLTKEALNETYKNGNKKSRTRSSRTRTKSKRKKESESYEETLERFEELKPEIEEKYGLD